ncbi:myosin heavy chain, putative [Babesia ovis]|uniref:Myosin heavy chain, putative n=1 Tax=Babesia ovis TaxID=5869 RepID=A0A9W5TEI4_BABOV|nr:myosin heavy chain, putative [Babesia ovis]
MASVDAIRSEIASIDSRLKQWFLFRRVQAERAMSIKKLMDDNNFVGLACNNNNIDVVDRVMWSDIVKGRPELEDTLSVNAREMKADMYMDIFTQSCDLDHVCRLPGSKYFQCLQQNFSIDRNTRSSRCDSAFSAFDTCRKGLQLQQNANLQEALKRQQMQDSEAEALFNKRMELMKKLEGLGFTGNIELRDHLRSVATTYSTLCLYLREVESLSDLVASDYYELQYPSEEMAQRLDIWRSLERRIFSAMQHHQQHNFRSYRKAESDFLAQLNKSRCDILPKRDCGIRLKVHRFKEGVIAMKYANEARRRVTNIADFILEVKALTGRAPDDYWDNMVILQALCGWVKEVIKDSVRCTASSSEKFKDEESNGQIVYSNDVIRGILNFCSDHTTVDKPPVSKMSALIERMLSHYTSLDRLSIAQSSSKPLSSSTSTPSSTTTTPTTPPTPPSTSQITYYLFNLLRDLRKGGIVAKERLEPFRAICEGLNTQLYIPRPIHVYQHHEYFCNLAKSCEFVAQVHSIQQMLLQTVSSTFAAELLQRVSNVINCPEWSTLDVRVILTAIRACHYLSNCNKKKLLGIWDNPPYKK